MKPFISLALAIVLVAAVVSSVLTGTMASFLDTEEGTENYLCAGTMNLEVNGERLNVENAVPCKWYSSERLLINVGTLDATATAHIKNLVCIEDAPGAGVAL